MAFSFGGLPPRAVLGPQRHNSVTFDVTLPGGRRDIGRRLLPPGSVFTGQPTGQAPDSGVCPKQLPQLRDCRPLVRKVGSMTGAIDADLPLGPENPNAHRPYFFAE